MQLKKSAVDMIHVDEAIGWIERNNNPMIRSLMGDDFMAGIVAAASEAVRTASKDGLIRRGEAVCCINEVIPEDPPAFLDSWRRAQWPTIRAMMRESLWYPAAYEVDH